ncbi:MAG: proteasome subunit alpha [Armatimonadota bacterium]|nr:proteasome subunit alpha [Armatimonadota bacterium]MCX7776906.1 proteasome subunit alpha [Armatimonadota bacterium]MDW8024408.1 proteasome subunit alpha [Armatimonadota bacterium]
MNVRGDFLELLRAYGYEPLRHAAIIQSHRHYDTQPEGTMVAHGTTVIAVKFSGGVLNVADRRAMASNTILYEEAEKIMALDDYTLIAIAGSYARAIEAVRLLRHSFKYYARSQLQELSLEGKLNEVSRVLMSALPELMQGIGGFLPIVSTYDLKRGEGRIFFYDALGARFESREYGAVGSGAERIRGALDYIVRKRCPFHKMELEEALQETMLLLDIASGIDPATGGVDRALPLAKTITKEGIATIPNETLEELRKSLRPQH